jgi:ParB family chromosome partitioning protein
MQIIEIDPRTCKKWKYADRSAFEYGDTNTLAEDIKKNGQIEPVRLRALVNDNNFQYEVIAGNRRFQACLNASIKMKAIIENISDYEASIIQIKENEKAALSDYSKGLSFSRLKQDNKLTEEQISSITGLTRRKVQDLLYFSKIDKSIWDAVANMSKVSSRSAQTIYLLSKKSPQHKEALIEIAEDIRKGAGSVRIEKLVNDIILDGTFEEEDHEVIKSDSGQIFATWKKGKLHFSKNLDINKEEFNMFLVKFFAKKYK